MRILVACEFSGRVRDAFIRAGHDATSCDLLPTDVPGPHYQGDVRDLLTAAHDWDMIIAHPPCTHLSGSGARWWDDPRYPNRRAEQQEAAEFFMALYNAPASRVAVENPYGYMSTYFRKPDQYIQPYQFGHLERKKTGLWLRNLPPLVPTTPHLQHSDAEQRVWKMPPSANRTKLRSITYQGIADAMAAQWGSSYML